MRALPLLLLVPCGLTACQASPKCLMLGDAPRIAVGAAVDLAVGACGEAIPERVVVEKPSVLSASLEGMLLRLDGGGPGSTWVTLQDARGREVDRFAVSVKEAASLEVSAPGRAVSIEQVPAFATLRDADRVELLGHVDVTEEPAADHLTLTARFGELEATQQITLVSPASLTELQLVSARPSVFVNARDALGTVGGRVCVPMSDGVTFTANGAVSLYGAALSRFDACGPAGEHPVRCVAESGLVAEATLVLEEQDQCAAR